MLVEPRDAGLELAALLVEGRADTAGLVAWVERTGCLELRESGPLLLADGVALRGERGLAQRTLAWLRARGLEGVRLVTGLAPGALEALGDLVAGPGRGLGMRGIELLPERAVPAALRAHRVHAWRAYVAALHARCGFASGTVQLHAVRRSVHRLIDLLEEDETALVGLACTVRSATLVDGGEAPAHDVNVAVLALVVGRALGCGRQELAALGVAALLHDIALDEGDVAEHPLRGASRLVAAGVVEGTALAALVALEHHVQEAGTASLATRTVQVADVFDRRARGASHIFASLRRVAGAQLDARLLDVLERAVGTHPPGSTVELEDGTLGVVLRVDPDACDRPHVQRVFDAAGQPAHGVVSGPVLRVVDPEPFGFDPVALFLP